MKQLALRYAAVLAALMVILAIITPAGSAHAEPYVPPSQVAVLLNTSQTIVQYSDGSVISAAVWETPGNGARWYSVGYCLSQSCSIISSSFYVDETDGRVYAAGNELSGLNVNVTRDDEGQLLGLQVLVDNQHYAFR